VRSSPDRHCPSKPQLFSQQLESPPLENFPFVLPQATETFSIYQDEKKASGRRPSVSALRNVPYPHLQLSETLFISRLGKKFSSQRPALCSREYFHVATRKLSNALGCELSSLVVGKFIDSKRRTQWRGAGGELVCFVSARRAAVINNFHFPAGTCH
jgi:hypothetical protein